MGSAKLKNCFYNITEMLFAFFHSDSLMGYSGVSRVYMMCGDVIALITNGRCVYILVF